MIRFVWSDCDMTQPGVVEEVYKLLEQNYVEDDDNMFRWGGGGAGGGPALDA